MGSYTSKMYIYKDVFCGDELFSDTYPIKIVDDVLYEVTGKHETRTEGEIVMAGSNASDEGADPNSVSGVDVILNHRLVETGFGSKKDYAVYLKDYMKRVIEYLTKNDRADEVDLFKKNINGVMKELIGKFKDLQFFSGESMDPDAMILILDYREVETPKGKEERPVLLAFKHGLEAEKV